MFGFGKVMSHEEAYKLMNEDKNVIVVDVREENEFKGGHIKGAKNVPLSRLDYTVEAILSDKTKKYLVYCYSGARSRSAVNVMKNLGFSDVHDFGGIMRWTYGVVR